MKKTSSKLAVFLFVVAFGCLLGPMALRAFGFGYTGCVVATYCETYPPAGMYCDVLYPFDGSTAQNNASEPTSIACGYIYGADGDGWACGGAVVSDPPVPCSGD
jgi:hypothetical protein